MANPKWIPGEAQYSTWLKTLTPEEYQAHLDERKVRKSMKQAMKEVFEANQAVWIAKINNAMVAIIDKAEVDADPQALAVIYDRIVGKPDSNVDVTSNGKTIQAPTIVFASKELDDWKDDRDDQDE